ncbi:MAG: hypothetical protein AABZ47_16335 [Planctomycetota bacterium]
MTHRKNEGVGLSKAVRRFIVRFLSVVVFANSISAFAAEPVPPKPNPAEPVNYVEWINKTFGGVQSNAYADYKSAAELWKPFDGDLSAAISGPWGRNEPVANWLKANQPAMEKFRAASAKTGCYFPLEPGKPTSDARTNLCLLFADQAAMTLHRDAFHALIAQGYQAWGKGDEKTLRANALLLLRSVRHLDASPLLLRRLMANKVAAGAHEALRKAIKLTEDPEAFAQALVEDLAKADPPQSSLQRTMNMERLHVSDLCQRLFVPGKEPGTWTLYDPVFNELTKMGLFEANDKSELVRFGFDETLRELNAHFDQADKWLGTPFPSVTDGASELARLGTQSKNPFSKKVLPSFDRARVLHEHCAASRSATFLIAHLFIYRAKSKEFPASLDKLQGSGIAQLKIDPFSGRDFVYRKQDDGFLLYSVSTNMKDDGGKHDPQMKDVDFAYWPVPK